MNTEQFIEHVENADIENIRANFGSWMQLALDVAGEEEEETEEASQD